MSPDIEWQVGDESGQHTIAKTPPRRPPSRWRKIAVAVVVFLGIGLGVIYTSTPEPPPPPTPTPTPLPPPVATTVAREAQAIASGNLPAFVALQDPNDAQWHQSQLAGFKAWGTPPTGELYAIIDSGALSLDRAWVDVIQFRDGQYFRETRFYRLQNNEWARTRPAQSFWGEQQTIQTPHFDVMFRAGDGYLARVVADYFEKAYRQLCADLGCQANADGLLRVSRIRLIFDPEVDQSSIGDDGRALNFTLPSPRMMGLYYQSLFDNRNYTQLGSNPSIEHVAYGDLIPPVARIASANVSRASEIQGGDLFVEAIAAWEVYRIRSEDTQADALFNLGALKNTPLIPLPTVWTLQIRSAQDDIILEQMQIEASSVVAYIEQQYGPESVIKFLNAIGPAGSLPKSIEASLGIKYLDFEQQWQAWLKQHIARQ